MFPKSNNNNNSHMRRISDTGGSRFTLPPLNRSSSSSSSSSSRHNNTSTPSLPPLHFNNNNENINHNNSPYPSTTAIIQQQKNTYSYTYPPIPPHSTAGSITATAESSSRPATIKTEHANNRNIHHEEYYYPVYHHAHTKHEWSEDEAIIPTIVVNENTKNKKKREMDERIKEIDREFLDNREVLYEEKIKQLQDELVAVEKGHHETFDQSIADLEQKRQTTIHNARLMMIYQISSVDQECNLTFKQVQDESLAEQKEIQTALFNIIEEKRKKLKEEKDEIIIEGGGSQAHQTRNRQRLQRKKRGELENLVGSPHTPPTKKKLDKQRERDKASGTGDGQNHLLALSSSTHKSQEEIEQDFYEMTRRRRL